LGILNFFADDPMDLPESIGQQKAKLAEGECRSLLVLQREMIASTRTSISTMSITWLSTAGLYSRD
jgi:hypothetical protein